MYLLGAAAKITWVIEATATPPVLADLDVLLINPEGTEVYLNSPIAAGDYTAPTDTIDGSASYTLTPDIEGLWKILLVIGTASSYTQLSKVEMQVLDNATTTNPVAVYLKTQVTSEAIKVPCEVATTVNITLSGLQTIDLLAVAEADRVLVKDQTDTTENGLYNASSGAWIRTVDFDQDAEITNGVMVLDNNAGVMYGIRFTGSMDVGVTEITFAELAITDSPLAEILNNVEYAEEWAIKPEDTLVSAAAGGDQVDDYSAMHFSIKAADDATLASGHAVDADTARGLAVVAQGLSEDAQAASELAEDGAEAVYQVFDDRYLGDHATNPTTLNDLVTALDVSHDGIEFWDSTLKVRKVFNGSTLTWGLTSTSVATNAVDVNVADSAGNFTGTNIETVVTEIFNWFTSLWTKLASTASGEGASMVGIEDSSGYFTGNTIEEVTAEVGNALGGLKTAIFEIGIWNMNASNGATINVASIGASNIRSVSASVRKDGSTSTSDLVASIDGFAGSSAVAGSVNWQGTNVFLDRLIGGVYNTDPDYNGTVSNRGWIVVHYV